MALKWIAGTAAVALIAATPALAQTGGSALGGCTLDDIHAEAFQTLDTNRDSRLTVEEYRACFDQAGIAEGERQSLEQAFIEIDTDGDTAVALADIETRNDGRPQGTITVTQPAANVQVQQPAPEVNVTQAEPTVNVEQRQPEVAVETPRPEVQVSQAQPQVAVSQPEPQVEVTQPEAEIAVNQPDPQVNVEAGQPAVNVQPTQPRVAVETPEPQVAVEQPELNVDIQQAQPDVAVQQAEPQVNVARAEGANVATTEPNQATGNTGAMAPAPSGNYQIRLDDLVGKSAYNSAGEEIGNVEEVVLDPGTQRPMVILKSGGLLGIGAREVMFSYDDLTVSGDRVVVNTAMTADEIGDMPEYDETAFEPLPETMIVR